MGREREHLFEFGLKAADDQLLEFAYRPASSMMVGKRCS